MRNLGRIRKTIVAALGSIITVVLLIPEENIPERWRPVVGIVLALGTIAGVYKVRNDRPVTREDIQRKVDYHGHRRVRERDDQTF